MPLHPDDLLTPREHQVVELVACVENDGQIAARLGISSQTVTHCVRNACMKLSAPNRTAAAVRYDRRYGCPAAADIRPLGHVPLSHQERRAMEMVAEGISKPMIAAHRGVTRSTVKQHLLSARRKLGAPNVRPLSYMKKTGGDGEG